MMLKKMLALVLAMGLMLNSVPILAAEDESGFEETFEAAEEIENEDTHVL
ncbi:hypothetical protein WMO28_04875 [Blautia sp. CLA-JM-H16]|uniref:Secreted protein n=1 Tax=Blautia aquisgranensis TaxID=3133153 RepID=A0ABV1BCF0_9FIRM